VIFTLPSLKFLDSTPVTKAERDEAALRGRFLKVIKPALCPNVNIFLSLYSVFIFAVERGRFVYLIFWCLFWRIKHSNLFSQDLESDEERKKFLPLPPAKSVLTHKGMNGI
jgi:hypothetical protein